MSMIQTFKHQN